VSDRRAAFEPLATGERGHGPQAVLETQHWGALSVVDGTGREIAGIGDTDRPFPLRSTAKPFQLLPFLLDRAHLELSREERLADLAVMMSSHSGEPMHTGRVARLLERAGLGAEALACGVHPPFDEATRNALARAGQAPNALHCNCSGKHTNMLIVCRRRGWPIDDYLSPAHPLQRRILGLIAALAGCEPRSLKHVTDGCSLPTAVLSLTALARLYGLLGRPERAPEIEGRPIASELALLFEAGVRHPELVAGSARLDTELMRLFAGRLFAKTGAAGVYAMAIPPFGGYPHGLGIAFKIADGDADSRIRRLVAVEACRQLGVVCPTPAGEEALETLAQPTLLNFRGRAVGRLRAAFELGPAALRG